MSTKKAPSPKLSAFIRHYLQCLAVSPSRFHSPHDLAEPVLVAFIGGLLRLPKHPNVDGSKRFQDGIAEELIGFVLVNEQVSLLG
ncbi:MAG: hypothetical protein IKY83_12680 [Proteobacteria bacterium]|nr:hypothetical protein [Pseudomonadota bacterium]